MLQSSTNPAKKKLNQDTQPPQAWKNSTACQAGNSNQNPVHTERKKEKQKEETEVEKNETKETN
jgi:hypothetical protein